MTPTKNDGPEQGEKERVRANAEQQMICICGHLAYNHEYNGCPQKNCKCNADEYDSCMYAYKEVQSQLTKSIEAREYAIRHSADFEANWIKVKAERDHVKRVFDLAVDSYEKCEKERNQLALELKAQDAAHNRCINENTKLFADIDKLEKERDRYKEESDALAKWAEAEIEQVKGLKIERDRLAELNKALINEVKNFKYKCTSTSHDARWCSICSNAEDAIEQLQAKVEAIGKGES